MRNAIVILAFVLSGCAGGEATRWIHAESRTVTVDEIPYGVGWVRDANGIDMQGQRASFIHFMPDEMIERRRNTEAAMIVGASLCGGKATVSAEMKNGDLYATRIKCG